ncbi:hypothetical protein AVEN_22332-1 [Araneus ventricosus]|uniref:Uncharacterized protein n=1 Tax=Araneus ventricosus TaxID=182803 RepID=A0A4Y2HCA3_ARAVE|nr:hypothetical protein AVEN_22332-1 [Araneus ventricosus]
MSLSIRIFGYRSKFLFAVTSSLHNCRNLTRSIQRPLEYVCFIIDINWSNGVSLDRLKLFNILAESLPGISSVPMKMITAPVHRKDSIPVTARYSKRGPHQVL